MTASTTPLDRVSDRSFFIFNGVVSAAALAFLAWLLLIHPASAPGGTLAGADVRFLPAVNASLNALSALCLVAGYVAIRRRARNVHQSLMISAFASSSLFLVCYLVYHYVHGSTRYVGAARGLYLAILGSHVLLSMAVVPLALTSFFFAFRRQFDRHRRVTKVTLPIWLYVSVTGVVVFFMLRGSVGGP